MRLSFRKVFHDSIIFLHKWLGVTLALLFLMWFMTGLVLYFVPFPELTQFERLIALKPIKAPPNCCVTAQQAADQTGLVFSEARLGMLGEIPVWRLLGQPISAPNRDPLWHVIDAQSAKLVAPLSPEAAKAVAETFSGRRAVSVQAIDRDQWTVPQGLNPFRPLLRVEMDSPDGLELYVSPAAGEVVRDTRREERFWNWLGAVPHWIYFTELRRYPEAWHNVVVWLSIPGVILAVTGIVLGIWHLFLNQVRWIPYRRFWMKWHHIGGLVTAIFTLTWIFSGLLSMNPFGVFSPKVAMPTEQTKWAGPPSDVSLNPVRALIEAQEKLPDLEVKEIDVLRIAGQTWYRLRTSTSQALVRADGRQLNTGQVSTDQVKAPVLLATLPDETVQASLRFLRNESAQISAPVISRIHAYDDLYYAREMNSNTPFKRPLPVWRAQWSDGVAIYADPASGRLVLRADTSTGWQRILYNGLHSFDFAFLLSRPWLRNILVVVLSLLGIALCITSCVIAWRVLFKKVKVGINLRRIPAINIARQISASDEGECTVAKINPRVTSAPPGEAT